MKLFFQRLFSFRDHDGTMLLRPKKLFAELIVVFVGVYLAFVLSNYSENQKIELQKKKILISLKSELAFMMGMYPGMAQYQEKMVKNWKDSLKQNIIDDFFEYRYVQPQYNYMVLEYAINGRETGVVEFSLYKKLLHVYQAIKQVEYAEEKMTEFGAQYHPIAESHSRDYNSPVFLHNQFLFSRFIVFANDRAGILRRIASSAAEVLIQIDSKFTVEELAAIEKEILTDYFSSRQGRMREEDVYEYAKGMFPKMSEARIREIIGQIQK